MAIYRKIKIEMWSDPFFSELTQEQKLFYIYLLTNERTKQCGIYDIPLKKISYDLDMNKEKVNELIQFFTDVNKIMYSNKTSEIALMNWFKNNQSTSPKVLKCIKTELENVKNTVLIEYIYGIDTVGIEYRNSILPELYSIDTVSQEEEEEEPEEEKKEKEKEEKAEAEAEEKDQSGNITYVEWQKLYPNRKASEFVNS